MSSLRLRRKLLAQLLLQLRLAAAFMNVPGRHVASPAPAFSGLGPRPAAFRDKVPHASTRAKGPRPQVAVCHGLDQFQSSHAFLISVIITIGSRFAIMELRRRIEKPVMDELGNRVAQEVTPDADQIDFVQWAKLAACIGLDLAGDASELIPFLGEFTDVAFAPVEAALVFSLFKSPLLSGIGFVEEILPFTDVIPTFCICWCVSYTLTHTHTPSRCEQVM